MINCRGQYDNIFKSLIGIKFRDFSVLARILVRLSWSRVQGLTFKFWFWIFKFEDADGGTRTRNPGLQTQCSSHWAIQLNKLLLGRSWVYSVGVLHHYIFIISQLWLTSHPRSTVVLLDTGTPGTSREIYSEDADGGTRTRNPWITNPVL